MEEKEILKKISELPVDLRKEFLKWIESFFEGVEAAQRNLAAVLRSYVNLLRCMRRKSDTKEFKFDWEDGLSEIKDKFTSVELQHRASEWR